MRKRVYIAGPIVKGDLAHNIRQACFAGLQLVKAGFAPVVPHTSCYWGQVFDEDGLIIPEVLPGGTMVEDWYDSDMPWVEVADAVLRLPGEGKGSDDEVAHAVSKGIPVFYSVADVIAWGV